MAIKRNLAQTLILSLVGLAGLALLLSALFGDTKAEKAAKAEQKELVKKLEYSSAPDPKAQTKKFAEAVAAAAAEQARLDQIKKDDTERLKAEQAALTLGNAKANGKSLPGYPAGSPNGDSKPYNGTQAGLSPEQQMHLAKQIEQEKMLEAVRGSKIAAWEDTSFGNASMGNPARGNTAAAAAGLPSIEELTRIGVAAGNAASGAGQDTQRDAMREAILKAGQPQSTPSLDARNVAFMKDAANSASRNERDKATAMSLPKQPLSKHMVQQGWRIPAVLITDINSDLPGDVQAMVVENVRDSISGQTILIPQGSKLIGVYNSEVAVGQERLLFAFTRMIYPNGVSVELGSMNGSDRFGASGVVGDVNNRFWSIFGSSLLVGAVSTLATRSAASSSVSINVGGALTQTAGSVMAEVIKKMLERNINIKPSINLKRGEKFAISVAHDLILPPAITSKNGL